MVDFSLTKQQNLLREKAHNFAFQYIIPKEKQYDKNSEFPIDVINKAREYGLINTMIPIEYGGLGFNNFDRVIISEELAWGCSGVAAAIMVHEAAILPLLIIGSHEQKEKYFKKMLEGKLFGFAFTEPHCGTDVLKITTEAKKIDGGYIINGKKSLISNIKYSEYFILFARVAGEDSKVKIAPFIIDSKAKGFRITEIYNKLGQRASDTGEIELDNVFVPIEDRIGGEDGLNVALSAFEQNRSCCAAMAVGVAKRAFGESLRYIKERKAFDKPIWKHQAIGHMVADMAIKLESMRLLTWKAVWSMDINIDMERYSSYAKTYATDCAMEICTNAVQIFGGYGVLKHYPVEKLMRDIKVCQIYEGTSQIQKDIIIRQLIKRKD